MQQREYFKFYREYWDLIITSKNANAILIAVFEYAFDNIEPNLRGHDLAIFNMIKWQIDKEADNE